MPETKKIKNPASLLAAIAAIGGEITNSRRSSTTRLTRVLDIILNHLGAEQGSIMLLEKDRLVVRAAKRKNLIGMTQPLSNDSVATWVAKNARPLFIPDITHDHRFPCRKSDRSYRKNSLLSAPVMQQGKVLGVINVTDKSGNHDLIQDDAGYLAEFCGIVVWLVQQQQLNKKIRQQKNSLKKKNLELKRQEELREELAQALIHDLKGPLAEVVANLDILSYSLDGDEKEFLQSAQMGCDRAVRMVSNLVSVGKLEDGRLRLIIEQLTPAELIAEAGAGITTLTTIRQMHLKTEIADGKTAIPLDRTIIIRVLQNLLTNAISYSPSGSTIIIGCKRNGDGMEFYVRDQGPGIPPEMKKYIFDKYARISSSEEQLVGTGLGLYFCRLAIKAHHGVIGVENNPDGGGRFYFQLPLPNNRDHGN